VDGDGVGGAQAALVVAARDIEAVVETGFDAPCGAIEREPIDGVEALGGQAGHEGHGLCAAAFDFSSQEGALGGEGKVRLLRGDGSALNDAGFLAAFIALASAGLRLALDADLRLLGGLFSGSGGFREKRQPGAAALCVRYFV
jgi:hypothetical protein